MKRLLMGVFVFALIFSSCNKYADDFQALKDQIATLGTQIKAISDLQTTIASQTATIAALQQSITTLSTTVDGLGTKMTALSDSLTAAGKRVTYISNAIAGIVSTGSATKAVVDQLKTDLGKFITDQNAVNADFLNRFKDLQTKAAAGATSLEVLGYYNELVTLIKAKTTVITDAQKTAQDKIITDLTDLIKKGDAATFGEIANQIGIYKAWADEQNKANVKSIEKILSDLASAKSTGEETNSVVDGLAVQLGLANGKLNILLQANAMINEDITIRNHSDLIYWANKIVTPSDPLIVVPGVIVNGNVSVNTKDITTPEDILLLKKTLNRIIAVIGLNAQTVSTITGWWAWTFIDPIGGPIWGTVTLSPLPGVAHWVNIVSAKANDVEINNLAYVIGDYTVLLNDVLDKAITTIGGTMTYNYPGGYDSDVKTVGHNLILVDLLPSSSGIINLPNVTVGGFIGNGLPIIAGVLTVPTDGTVSWNSTLTTSITLGLSVDADADAANGVGQVNNLTANSATYIKIGTVIPLSYTITAGAALTIDLSAATSTSGPAVATYAINIATKAATAVNLSKLVTTVGDINIVMTAVATPFWSNGDVDLNSFIDNQHVTINGPQTINKLNAWYGPAGSLLSANRAITVNLPHYQWLAGTEAVLPLVEDLTLGGAADVVTISNYATLKKVDITGTVKQLPAGLLADHWLSVTANVVSTGTASTGNPVLWSAKLGGLLASVDLNGGGTGTFPAVTPASFKLPLLTTVNTWGIISSFRLNNAGTNGAATPVVVAETVLDLKHKNFVGAQGWGGPGSDMVITNNPAVKGLTTHTDIMSSLYVINNKALSTMAFGSYVTVPNYIATSDPLTGRVACTQVDMAIYGNHISGTWSPALTATAETLYKEAQIWSTDLSTLKKYVNDVAAVSIPAAFTLNLQLDVDKVTTTGFAYWGVNTLGWAMNDNKLVSLIISDTRTADTAISTKAEMNLLQ